MFKERFKIFFIELLNSCIIPIAFLGLVVIVIFSYPLLADIIAWGMVITFSIVLVVVICIFVHWLFIEPYKNWKNNKKEKDL